jgi:hypothetical protein
MSVERAARWQPRVVIDPIAARLGADNTSAAEERSIIRRASTLTVELERLEAKFAVANDAQL